MDTECKGWGNATPDSPYHPYNWEVQTYHYVYENDRLNTLRVKAIIATMVVDSSGEFITYGYPQLEVLELPKDFTQLDVWRLHFNVMQHLVYCDKCTDKELCIYFYREFNYPKYIDQHDPNEDWDNIPF